METVARRWSARWSLARSAAPAMACETGGGAAGRPDSRLSAGSRNRMAHTSAETGLPGRPSTGTGPSRPNNSGFPGRMAICQKSSSRPRVFSAFDDEVVVAHRCAAGGDQHVDAVHRVGHRGNRLARVLRDRQHDRLAAGGAHQGGERMRVRTDDAAGRDRLARHGDLVAGGEDRDARPAVHSEPRMVGGGGKADVACGDAPAGGHHGVAGGEVLAGAADMPAGRHRLVHPDLGAGRGRVLLQQDGVGAGRAPRCR